MVALSHLSWPMVAFEWTNVPFTVTSKLPVFPSSEADVTATPEEHSVSMADWSALAYLA